MGKSPESPARDGLRMRLRPAPPMPRASRPRVVLCCLVILVATRSRKFAKGDDDMAFQARVYLQRPHETSSTPIGKILVEMLPPGSLLRLHCQIKFTYRGEVAIGRVNGIVPEK